MDPHEDLVALNRAAINAHYAEIARLASENPDANRVELLPEDQAVLDAKRAVEEAQTNLIAAQQAAYTAKVERADAAAEQAVIDAEAERVREAEERQARVNELRTTQSQPQAEFITAEQAVLASGRDQPRVQTQRPYVKPPIPAYIKPRVLQSPDPYAPRI